MAEGDSIRRLANRLDRQVGGRLVAKSVIRHNRYATWDLAGRTLAQVDARGKHVLMRLHDGEGRPALTVHSHLRMSGRWTVGVPPRTPRHRRRVELHLDDGRILTGIDLPVLHIGRTDDEHRWVGHLGPDLCAPTFDADRAAHNLRVVGATPLAQGLLDQRTVAGIGNLYAVELPFLVGVSPWHPLVAVEGLPTLTRLARLLLTVNASTGHQSTTGRTHRRTRHWLYGRRGCPCPVCGAEIQGAEVTPWQRPTWWCPVCQTSGVVDLQRARRLLREHRLVAHQLGELPPRPPDP